jgi:GNAT superfamily N-acetyltransferase
MSDRISFRELLTPGDPAVSRAYQILQETFPTSELVRLAEFLRALTERAAGAWSDLLWHMIVGERGPKLEGVVTGTYLASLNVGFIGYLAVDRSRRANGLGARLRNTLLEVFDGDAWRLLGRPMDGVVGEVEPDNPWLATLIQRHGAIALDLPYCQPPLRHDQPEVPLVLYYQPLREPRSSLPVVEVRQLLFSIWRYAYRVKAPFEDPRFRDMMRALVGREEIGSSVVPPLAARVAEA